jgi:hypothetical protein
MHILPSGEARGREKFEISNLRFEIEAPGLDDDQEMVTSRFGWEGAAQRAEFKVGSVYRIEFMIYRAVLFATKRAFYASK